MITKIKNISIFFKVVLIVLLIFASFFLLYAFVVAVDTKDIQVKQNSVEVRTATLEQAGLKELEVMGNPLSGDGGASLQKALDGLENYAILSVMDHPEQGGCSSLLIVYKADTRKHKYVCKVGTQYNYANLVCVTTISGWRGGIAGYVSVVDDIANK